jgi:hypothetical protein
MKQPPEVRKYLDDIQHACMLLRQFKVFRMPAPWFSCEGDRAHARPWILPPFQGLGLGV